MGKKNVPEIRFPGFENEWVQHKLSDLYSEGWSGGTPTASNAEFYKGSIPYLSISDLKSREIFNTEKHITQAAIDSSAAKLKPAGYLALAMYASVGKIAIINVDSATSQAFWNMRFENEITRNFVFSRLQKADNCKEWEPLISTGTQRNLNAQKVSNLKIYTPSIDEQEKIGSFFQYVDNVISIHLKKLEDLQKLKSGLLQKMFPRKGEKVPQIRFPEFNDDWEQRKLSDIAERVTRKNTDLETTLPLTISAQYGLVDQETFFNKRVASSDISGYFLIRSGEFAYNKSTSNASPYGAIKRLDLYDKGALSTLYIVFKLNEDISPASDFYTSYFDGNQWHKEIIEIATEGARNHGLLNVSPVDFMNIEMNIPPTMEEQIQIGAFFKKVDETITLHQQKIGDLNRLKSGLLKKMFA